jgi:transposase-like protein
MRRYSEAVKADVIRRISPLMRQSVARISQELGIHVVTLYKLEKGLAVAGRGGAGIRERPSWLECCRQVYGGAGIRLAELH